MQAPPFQGSEGTPQTRADGPPVRCGRSGRRGWEDPLPRPFPVGVRILAVPGIGANHPAGAGHDIGGVLGAHGGSLARVRSGEIDVPREGEREGRSALA